MDIYGFFNSKDIAEHLKGLHYEFTLPEAAFLVYQNKKRTMEEKCAVWRELMDTMPDCSMEKRVNMHSIESVHQFLLDYMALQEKLLRMFYEDDGSLYTYELYENCGWRTWKSNSESEDAGFQWVESGVYFADTASALAHFEKEYKGEEGVQRIRFLKKPLLRESDLERNGEMVMTMSSDLEAISIDYLDHNLLSDEEDTLYRQFDGMCFAFPTPFGTGDILIDRTHGRRIGSSGVFVLGCINTWDSETLLQNGFAPQHPWVKSADKQLESMLKSADISDMHYHGYFLDTDGVGLPVLCEDTWYTYLNLERYDAPLQGMDRALKALSSAMKIDPEDGEILIGPSLLCNAYQLLVQEQLGKVNRQFLEAWYTDEGLALAGLKEESNSENANSD